MLTLCLLFIVSFTNLQYTRKNLNCAFLRVKLRTKNKRVNDVYTIFQGWDYSRNDLVMGQTDSMFEINRTSQFLFSAHVAHHKVFMNNLKPFR